MSLDSMHFFTQHVMFQYKNILYIENVSYELLLINQAQWKKGR